MKIEVFVWDLWVISWIRSNWQINCRVKPIEKNVYEIKKEDYYKLVELLTKWVFKLGAPKDYYWSSWDLFLKEIA
jgi:hypothetical protein